MFLAKGGEPRQSPPMGDMCLVPMWLCGYVGMWLCGYVVTFNVKYGNINLTKKPIFMTAKSENEFLNMLLFNHYNISNIV